MAWWKRLPFFYGWILVAVTFVCFAVGYATWHSFPIFYVAILEEYGWSRAATAGAFSLFTLVYGVNAMAAGGLVDRFGPRVVLPLAAILLGIGLILMTRMSAIWHFYAVYGVIMGIGLSGFGTVPSYTVLNNWFVKKRGTAMGFATAGIGVGTFVLVPALQSVISGYGWRMAYLVLALATVLIVPSLAAVFQRLRPQQMGLRPDGERSSARVATSRAEEIRKDVLIVDKEWVSREWSLATAVGTRRFWLLWIGRFLELAGMNMILAHQAAYFVDRSYDKLLVASVVATVGIMGSVGKIFWGFASDRLGREMAYALSCLSGTLGVGIMLAIGPGAPTWSLYSYAIIYGLFYGASAVLMPVIAADVFHSRNFGSILGGMYIGGGLGTAAGTFFAGWVFDVSRSYLVAFALYFPFMWLTCLLYWLAAPRKVRLAAGQARKAALQPRSG